MKVIDYRKGLIVSTKAIGWLFSLCFIGIAFIFSPLFDHKNWEWIGVILILTWVYIVFRKHGVIINYRDKKIQAYKSLFGIKWGKIRDISEFPYYRITRLTQQENLLYNAWVGQSYSLRSVGIVIYDKINKTETILIKKGTKQEITTTYKDLESIGMIRK